MIFAGNHISFLDGPVMFGASPRPMHILVKQEMFTGFLGRVLTASGQLPVDRAGDRAALQRQQGVLDAGRCVGILPEGTRGSGEAAAISNGVAWLALNSGATVVPVAILGTRKGGEHLDTVPRPRRRLHVSFGEAINSAAGPARPGVFQWTGRERRSAPRWPDTSRTPSTQRAAPARTRIPRTNVRQQ